MLKGQYCVQGRPQPLRDNCGMQKPRMDLNNLDLYRDLLATVIQSRMQMDAASARADLLLNIFDITVDNPGDEARFVERTINRLELELFDAGDAPERLQDATADMAHAIWAYHTKPTGVSDQIVRGAFERWEAVYLQSVGEPPTDTHMDIENARCIAEPDYYTTPPLPFPSRGHLKFGNQN